MTAWPLACAIALAGALAGASPGEARPAGDKAKRAVAKNVAKGVAKPGDKGVKAKAAAPQAHLIVVSLPRQRITVYGAEGLLAQSAVSTGMRGFPTPTGAFSIIQKNRHHRSNIYSGAPMPFMQRITWSGVALHAGILPGYPASHGCIRLTHSFAAELWAMTRMGARVIVAAEDTEPAAIAHPALPTPSLAAAVTAGTAPPQGAVVPISTGAIADRPAGDNAPAASALVGPLERARAERADLLARLPVLARAARAAAQLAEAKAADARRAGLARRETEQRQAAAGKAHDAALKAVAAARSPEALEQAKAAEIAAVARLAETVETAGGATAAEKQAASEAAEADAAAREAQARSARAVAAVRAGERLAEPVSVLVSRKTGKVYVRQAWAPVHEAPVTFKDPDAPLGTHVYVATGAADDGRGLNWMAVSLPPRERPAARGGGRGKGREEPQARPAPTAASVLERFELPLETRALIADRLWAGASLTVSDEGVGHETGKYTDFIVLTR